MRLIFIVIFLLFSNLSFSQKPSFGVDFGYQIGKKQYFETGLNLTFKNDNWTSGGTISVGIMDDINSEDIGYKIGLSGFNLKNGSIPLLIGFNIAQHNQNETKILAYSPEVGLAKKWHYFGSGIAYFSLSYGYSFTEAEFESSINSHYLKFLINTNMKGFIEFLGFTRYKVISIFHPNWS